MKKALFALAILAMLVAPASAATKYWDIDGATPEAGGATPSGNWNAATANWTFSSTGVGVATTFTNTDDAIFSAGTTATGLFTVTTTAPVIASSITVEEGTVRHAGTSANTLTTSALTIGSGATFGVNVALSFTPVAGSVATLNGGTIQNYNAASGGSFLTSGSANTNMSIALGTGGGHVSAAGTAGIVTIYTGLIKGTGPLSVDGTGTFRLTTTPATYSGDTIVNGRLQISTTANVLPDGTDMSIASGGTFDDQAVETINSVSGAGNIAFTNSATILTIAGSNSPGALTGVVSGTGNFTRAGTGTTTFGGTVANTMAGTTSVTGGTLELAKTAGVNAVAGATTVNGGTLKLINSDQIGDTAALTVTLGTFNMNGKNETVATIAGAGSITNMGDLTLAGTAATNFSGTLSGAGTFKKASTSTGITTLGGNSTAFTGNIVVDAGRISVQNAGALGDTTGNTQIASGAELQFAGAGTLSIAESLRIAGAGAGGGGAISASTVSSVNSLITLSGPVTLTGDATVTASTGNLLKFTNANAITALANQNLTIQGTTTASEISGAISLGTGSLTKAQGGTWVLSGTNSYSGLTTISSGTLSVSNIANNLGSNTTVDIGSAATGGNLTYTGTGETTSKVINLAGTTGTAFLLQSGTGNLKFTSDFTATGSGAKLLSLQGSTAGTGEISGKIVDSAGGATSVAKSGSGTWTLGGNNSYSGATTISAGTLSVSDIKNSGTNSNLGTGTSIALGATTTTGTLKYTGTGDTTNKVVDLAGTTGGGTIDQSGTGLLKFSADLTATGGGSKTLTLTGSAAGTGEVAGKIVDNSATNKTSVAKSGSGKWTLSGANTYSGSTTHSGGELALGNDSALGTSTLTVNNNATALSAAGGARTLNNAVVLSSDTEITGSNTLEMSGTVNLGAVSRTLNVTTTGATTKAILSGVISDTGGTSGIVKQGSGVLVLSGANTYGTAGVTGTTVSAGKLLVNNTIGSGTGAGDVVVNGGTLGGTGSIAGSVTVTSGSLAPGASINVLNIGGNLSMTGGSFDYEINRDVAPAVGADLNNVAGNLALASVALSASDLGTGALPIAMGTKFTLINYGGTWNGGIFTGLANHSTSLTIGLNRFQIDYDVVAPNQGTNFGGGSVGPGSHFVTITAVPEASAFLTLGLGGIFAIAAVWMGKRMGVNVLKA